MLFTVDGFSKRFGRIAALTDVRFEVRAGEVLGLIGPNGAGKTTLFECLAGVLPADAGTVRVSGRPIGPHDRASLLFYLPDGIAPWSTPRPQAEGRRTRTCCRRTIQCCARRYPARWAFGRRPTARATSKISS